jgi:hypothetical protein
MEPALSTIVTDFAACMKLADARRPQAVNVRSKERFQPGIGPHSESRTVELVASELRRLTPHVYGQSIAIGVTYPEFARQRCDLCIGAVGNWLWAIEVRMLRMLGDNGKLNDNILMHILSPYPRHRSALTDCIKLKQTKLARRKAILIYGYEHEDWPLDPAIEAFESLAAKRVSIGAKHVARFDGLVHPVHSSGAVYGWEIG